jgi:nucleotide-binding universal stress UspA family protein
MGVTIETVLVPVDASEESRRAFEYALAVATEYDAALHALYVLDEGVKRDVERGDIAAEAVASEQAEFLEAANELADEAGGGVTITHSAAIGFSPSRLTHHPGSVILDVAADVAADFIVVPRQPAAGERDEVIGKSAQYVLEYASQPVLSV